MILDRERAINEADKERIRANLLRLFHMICVPPYIHHRIF